MNNKLIAVKDELLTAMNKNTFEYNGYKISPYMQQYYPPVQNSNSSSPIIIQPEIKLFYQIIGPNCHTSFTEDQFEVIAAFLKHLEYKEDFENTIKN